jgi:hypothetical protein
LTAGPRPDRRSGKSRRTPRGVFCRFHPDLGAVPIPTCGGDRSIVVGDLYPTPQGNSYGTMRLLSVTPKAESRVEIGGEPRGVLRRNPTCALAHLSTGTLRKV